MRNYNNNGIFVSNINNQNFKFLFFSPQIKKLCIYVMIKKYNSIYYKLIYYFMILF